MGKTLQKTTEEFNKIIGKNLANDNHDELSRFLLSDYDCENNHVRPVIEHLYYNKPAVFVSLIDKVLNKNDTFILAVASACKNTDLNKEINILGDEKVKRWVSRDINALNDHAKNLYRYVANTPDTELVAVQGAVATISNVESKLEATRKANQIDIVVADLNKRQTELFPKNLAETTDRQKLNLLKNKLNFLEALHKHDALLAKQRDLNPATFKNIASMLFCLGIPNIVNKIVTGNFFFSTPTESIQRVAEIDRDLRPAFRR